jgi:outer membrane protein assembly factor BamB
MHRLPLVVLALSLALPLFADWDQFRGPTGQGHAEGKNLPTEWGPQKNVAWKTPIPGLGWSSPVVAGGKVYLTTAVTGAKGGVSLRALCLDAKTGGIDWDKEVYRPDPTAAAATHTKNSHASPTPAVEGGRVYVHFGHLGTACLDAQDGSRVWANADLKYNSVHGNGGSPVVVGDRLVFCLDGLDRQAVVALDRATGKVAWQAPRKTNPQKPFSFCTPLLITANGRDQLIAPGSEVLQSLDPKTGKELWRVRHGGYSVVPRPVFGNGLVYFSTGFDSPVLMAVRSDGTGDVTKTHVAWTARRNAPQSSSPVLVGDALYMVADTGVLTCLDAKTGAERWAERVGGNYSASLLHAGGMLYLLSEEGVGTVVRPGASYDPVATNKLPGEKTLASPAVDGDALLVRTDKHLYRFEKK